VAQLSTLGITTHHTTMNKDELQKYVNGLDDDVEIIVLTTKEQAAAMPRHCERIDFGHFGSSKKELGWYL